MRRLFSTPFFHQAGLLPFVIIFSNVHKHFELENNLRSEKRLGKYLGKKKSWVQETHPHSAGVAFWLTYVWLRLRARSFK